MENFYIMLVEIEESIFDTKLLVFRKICSIVKMHVRNIRMQGFRFLNEFKFDSQILRFFLLYIFYDM